MTVSRLSCLVLSNIDVLSIQGLISESSLSSITSLHTYTPCTCLVPSSFPTGIPVPQCKCASPRDTSPLLRIRWKRLIIDEGHVSANKSTSIMSFVNLLSVERRWCVTGTPTTNLLGLDLGMKSLGTADRKDGDTESVDSESESAVLGSDVDSMNDSAESDSLFGEYDSDGPRAIPKTPRIWNRNDREDVRKLMNIITFFLGMTRFKVDSQLIKTHVRDALFDPQRPRFGAIQVLVQIMEMFMIRHRWAHLFGGCSDSDLRWPTQSR
jgi:hypothetical protein